MRILFKILLFPVTLSLSVVVGFCRFVRHIAGGLLAVVSGLVFMIALLGLILPVVKLPAENFISMFALSFLISPFGLPKLADWLLDRLDGLNMAIRSI